MTMARRTFLILLTACLLVQPRPVESKIAVFTDGRILKVEDAYLEDDRIVLVLPDGGRIVAPAVRIDRVVADEVEDENSTPLPEHPTCPFEWQDHHLPEDLPFRQPIREAARKANLHPWLLASVVQAESAFDPNAVSRAGARGLTQLMPAAAHDQGVVDPFDPVENLRGGAQHLRLLLDRFDSLTLALAAYNAGAATVERTGAIPAYRETREYIRRVLSVFCPSSTERE